MCLLIFVFLVVNTRSRPIFQHKKYLLKIQRLNLNFITYGVQESGEGKLLFPSTVVHSQFYLTTRSQREHERERERGAGGGV